MPTARQKKKPESKCGSFADSISLSANHPIFLIGKRLSGSLRGRRKIGYFTATVTGALSKPATVAINGTALPGVMPFGTYAFT